MNPANRYPVSLDLRHRRVLVCGGGPVAARRARDLVTAGARIDVVAPWICEALVELVNEGSVTWHQRQANPRDLDTPERAWLVHCATGDRAADEAVGAAASALGIWVVDAGRAEGSPAWRPAVACGTPGSLAEGIQLAVTAGGDPRRAVAVRDALAAALDAGLLPVRGFRAGHTAASGHRGSVALVGGGPGDEGLITVRGRQLLAAADVVIADRLGPTSVLERLGATAEIIDVGKTPGYHRVPQHRINELLVEHAARGAFVVRLKGGDPFVLGRGGEEAQYCRAHGIPVEVVPGVTSAIAVPAAAGIPVTQRGITGSFVVISGHDGAAGVVRSAQAAPADATLVLLMAVAGLAEIADALVTSGFDPQTSVAVVERGWTPEQRTTTGTLATIGDEAVRAGVAAPAVVVIGEVVTMRGSLGDLRPIVGNSSVSAGRPALASLQSA